MVVDIRYHLGTLVAVFLALGLGILVGTALSSDGNALEMREEWLTAIETEFEFLREERRRLETELKTALTQTERHRQFAADISGAFINGRLEGERAAVVLLGDTRVTLHKVEEFLQQAGARVVRRAHLTPSFTDDRERLAEAMAHDHADAGAGVAALIAEALFSAADSPRITSLELDSLWFDASSVPGDLVEVGMERPSLLAVVVDGPSEPYTGIVAALTRAAADVGAKVAAIGPEGDSPWQATMEIEGIPYVADLGSPIGAVNLILNLAAEESWHMP